MLTCRDDHGPASPGHLAVQGQVVDVPRPHLDEGHVEVMEEGGGCGVHGAGGQLHAQRLRVLLQLPAEKELLDLCSASADHQWVHYQADPENQNFKTESMENRTRRTQLLAVAMTCSPVPVARGVPCAGHMSSPTSLALAKISL